MQGLQMRYSNNLEKQIPAEHILKRSSNTHESWGTKFFKTTFKTTTRIQLAPDAFSKSRLFMTFLTRIRVLRDVLIKNCALSDGEGNTSGLFNFVKACDHCFHPVFIFSPIDSPSKTMNNAFYFILKALSVLKIFKFLYFWPSLFFYLSAIALKDDRR